MPAIIEVRELTFDYPGLRALDRVDMLIEAGSITALVGSNGAGKTTLMRCLCGLERPVLGRIVVADIDVIAAPRHSHTKLGFLPDAGGLYDALTVSQCLTYAAAANNLRTGLEQRVQETAAQLSLSDRLTQRVGKLSRGQRQRVAIGQAIIHAPRVLILDEPATGLDPESRQALAGLFRTLQQRGMTLLVSSHILAELADYATHMLVLRQGRVIEQRALQGRPQMELRIELLKDADAAAGWLAQRSEIAGVHCDGNTLRVTCAPEPTAQAALLAALVNAGFSVLRFEAAEPNLQQSYLETLRTDSASRT